MSKNKPVKTTSHRSYRRSMRIACALLSISILANSALAAPEAARYVVVSTGEAIREARFQYLTSYPGSAYGGWTTTLLTFFGGKQVRTQISRVEIAPGGDINIRQGEPLNLTAIAYTSDGVPVGGVKFDWTIQDAERGGRVRPLADGNFVSRRNGSFAVTASAGGYQARVNVTVSENPALMTMRLIKEDEAAGRTEMINRLRAQGLYRTDAISSKRNYPRGPQTPDADAVPDDGTSGSVAKLHGPHADDSVPKDGAEPVAAPSYGKSRVMLRPADEDGWNNNNWWTADDPGNQTGDVPGTSPDAGAGNGNFQFSAPVVALPGRGIDLSLSLNYNSRVWSKSGSTMIFDAERGFPGPGWDLGFGKMMFMGTSGGCMLIDADGTKHGYTGSVSNFSSGTYSSTNFTGHTADGTFIDYSCYVSTYNGVTSMSGSASLPNGSAITYNVYSASGKLAFPTQIQDGQGNYINIAYRNNRGPSIQTVTDTLGRVVTFNYDSLGRLISIDVPKMNNAGVRTAVRLHYAQLTLNPGFSPGTTIDTNNAAPYVIDAIYYPGTSTGYWFGVNDSYSSYGMIAKVTQQRGMNWSGTAGDQGTVSPGTMTKRATYNYPLTPDYSLTDAPTYTSLTETWDGIDTADPVTTYAVNNNDTYVYPVGDPAYPGGHTEATRSITVTQPNGAISKQHSYRTPGAWMDGLLFRDVTADPASPSMPLGISDAGWEQGAYDSPRPFHTMTIDEKGQVLRTEFTYGASYNQVISQKEIGYDGTTLLKETRSTYENSSSYTGRHIFNLVKSIEVYDGGGNRVSKTDYEYDGNAVVNGTGNPNLKETPGVTMHKSAYDPFTMELEDGACTLWSPSASDPACSYDGQEVWVYISGAHTENCFCEEHEQVSAYDPNTIFRGNVTKITVYSGAANASGAISQTKRYDVTGNVVEESASCCELITTLYDDPDTVNVVDTQYAYPFSVTRGSSDSNSPLRVITKTVYDASTGLLKQSIDANGRPTTITYDAETLRPTVTTSSTGATSTIAYDEPNLKVTEEVKDNQGQTAGSTVKYLSGLGLVKREESATPNGTDIVETKYNKLGGTWKQSRPYRSPDTPQFSEKFYDLQGRVYKVVDPDGSETKAFYNETQRPDSASHLPGNTLRVMDAWGRDRWGRFDALGRLVEVVEPNPDRTANPSGSVFTAGSLMTKYTFDTLGRLKQVDQGSQVRKFDYDSLGRLSRQKLAEQTATLDDNGLFVGSSSQSAKWAEAFWYDDRSNLVKKTDARGVKTNLSYQINGAEDPLNRLQSRSYDLSGPLQPNLTINYAPPVTYSYMTTGDQSRALSIRTAGILTEDFDYDTEGRVKEYKQTVDYRDTQPMAVSYKYDSLDRIEEVTYPAQYGQLGGSRKTVRQSYDSAGRLSSLKYGTLAGMTQQAGDIVYNASEQTTSINIGPVGTNQVNEQYSFDSQTGLLTNQKALQNGNSLLDISYDYSRGSSAGSLNGKTGHLTKILDNKNHNKDRAYEFDALGRLTKATGGVNGALWNQQYTFDRYGNRTNVTATGVAADNTTIPLDGIPTLAFDQASNRITGSTNFAYDVAGNQTKALGENGIVLRFEYDAANRLQVVRRDTDGQLMQAFQFGSTNAKLIDYDPTVGLNTFYCSVGGTTLAMYVEYQQNVFTWAKSYTYLGNSQLATMTPNGSGETTEYTHPDRLGTRLVTNQSLGSSYEQAHLPFGKALGAESTGSTDKRFTSYDRSAPTGLDYAINRHYDSKQGRFTQVDPIGMTAVSLTAPQTLNLYSYCGNDAVNYNDPSGLFWGKLFKAIFKVFTSKWFRIALAVAITVLSAGAAGPLVITNLVQGALVTTLTTAGWVAAALSATLFASGVGAIASQLASKPKRSFPCPPTFSRVAAQFSRLLVDLLQNRSGHLTDSPLENGGWIYQRKNGDLFFLRGENAPKFGGVAPTRSRSQIEWTNPPNIKGARVIAKTHTHPYTPFEQDLINQGKAYGGPTIGVDDVNSAAENRPSIVVHQEGVVKGRPIFAIEIANQNVKSIPDANCRR